MTPLVKGDEGAERVAFFFRHRFSYSRDDQALARPQLTLRLRRDDGAVVYLNGSEVVRSNMPVGEITEQTFAASTVGGRVEQDFLDYRLDPGLLVEGENVLAVEVHQVKATSSDVSFDLELLVAEHSGTRLRELVPIPTPDLGTTAKIFWVLGEYEEALEAIDQVLVPLDASYEPSELRVRKEWRRRKAEVLQQAGRSEEAEAVLARVAAWPPRPPGLDSRQLDLGSLYNEGLYRRDRPAESSGADAMERLAETFDPREGPEFDLRGIIQLNSGMLPADSVYSEAEDFNARTGKQPPVPMQVAIPVGLKASKAHFLHTCRWGREEIGGEVARYVIHFEDGTSEPCPVRFGIHMTDHWIHGRSAEELSGIEHIAWKHDFKLQRGQGTLGLSRQTWENPHPGKTISHIDFVSAGAKAAPFLVAVTLE